MEIMKPGGLFIFDKKKPDPDPCAGILSIANDGCGNLTAVVTGGGPGPFTFAWTGPGGFTSSAQTISPLVAGTYTVGRVDCRDAVSAPFTPPLPLDFCACIDNADKFPRTLILSNFTGGSGAYTYSLNGGPDIPVTLPSTNIIIAAVPAGDILVIVVKDANCAGATPVTLVRYCPADSFDFNNALELDGVNDFIETTALIGTPIPSQGTIVCWFKNGDTPDFAGTLHGMDTNNSGGQGGVLWTGNDQFSGQLPQFSMRLNVGVVQARIGNTIIAQTVKPPFLDPNFISGWIFAALTWSRSGGTYTFKLYVGDDNSNTWLAPATGTNNTYANPNFTAFNWGAITNWRDPQNNDLRQLPFYGWLDDLRYFNRELDECELECLFNEGAGNSMLDLDPNLRVYYKLDETGGNTANNAGTGGGALNGLLKGFSGQDGANDSTWRTAFGSLEAWRLHSAAAQGVAYPAINFLGAEETIDTRHFLNNGDSFTIFTEIELHHPAPPTTPLSRALFGVFRPTNSQMHGQSISQIENCATPVHPWDCGIFDARVHETTGVLTIQIANLNDVLGTSLTYALPNWQNRKIGLGVSINAARKTIRAFYNDGSGGGSVEIINAVYDDVTPDAFGHVWTISSASFGGEFLFGTPCPWSTDFGSSCGSNGLKSQAVKLFDLHIYNAPFILADFHNWFTEPLGVTPVGSHNVRNERSLLAAPVQRRFRPLQKPMDYTALIDTGPLAQDGLLYKSINSFFTVTQIGADPNRCTTPSDWQAVFLPYAAVPGWISNRQIPGGNAFIID
jgi:hypothetical protein